ncbi:hypothetical protein EYD10_17081, partial [Varanus komodoensis]
CHASHIVKSVHAVTDSCSLIILINYRYSSSHADFLGISLHPLSPQTHSYKGAQQPLFHTALYSLEEKRLRSTSSRLSPRPSGGRREALGRAEGQQDFGPFTEAGTISVGIDATDLFDRYDEEYEDVPGSGFPQIEINKMHISQSIEAPLTATDTAILSGNLSTQNGNGGGSVNLALRRVTSAKGWGEPRCSVLNQLESPDCFQRQRHTECITAARTRGSRRTDRCGWPLPVQPSRKNACRGVWRHSWGVLGLWRWTRDVDEASCSQQSPAEVVGRNDVSAVRSELFSGSHHSCLVCSFITTNCALQFSSRGIRPGLTTVLARNLDKNTMGYLQWRWGIQSAMNTSLVRDTKTSHFTMAFQLGIPHSFIMVSYQHKFQDEDQTRVKGSLK